MPSGVYREGDTVFVRATVLVAAAGAFQVVVDDGVSMALTQWVPSRECARIEDIGRLPPIRRRGSYLSR